MSRNSKSDDEPSQQQTEDIESNLAKPVPVSNHADRAAEMIGAQHIEVTEEDVNTASLFLADPELTFLEQTTPPQNRQAHPIHPSMGLLPPNPRQVRPRIRCCLGHARGHKPLRKRVLHGQLHGSNCTTRLAAFLVLAHGQNPAPHFYEQPCLWLGNRTSLYGCLHNL